MVQQNMKNKELNQISAKVKTKPSYTWVDALLHLRETWVKQLVTAELYNELKLESIAIKIKNLR
jgi:hypothetical protein